MSGGSSRGATSGSSSKSRSGGGVQTTQRTMKLNRKTKEIDDKVITLRSAIFNANGKDKDVTEGIAPAFMSYVRNGINCTISFASRLTKKELQWAFDMVKDNMEDRYEESGYGWDDEDKRSELSEDCTRFLLVRDADKGDKLIGFVHFRFSVQGDIVDAMVGDTCTFIWDLHLEEEYQHKGLGKHLVTLLELITRRENLSMVVIPVQHADEVTTSWVTSALKGYVANTTELFELMGFDHESEVSAIVPFHSISLQV